MIRDLPVQVCPYTQIYTYGEKQHKYEHSIDQEWSNNVNES